MITYIYDGSFEGIMCAVYAAFQREERPDRIVSSEEVQTCLFEEKIRISTDPEMAEKICRAIKIKISPASLHHIIYAFFSEHEETGPWIYDFIQFGLKKGKATDRYLAHEPVWRIHQLSGKVSRERHRMLGLLRFSLLNHKHRIFYASYQPDFNITCLVAPHFSRRLTDQNWIIHDTKRNLAAVFDQTACVITPLTLKQLPPLAEKESYYRELWQEYHHTMGIAGRFNPRLQQQHLPKKYWPFLIERMT